MKLLFVTRLDPFARSTYTVRRYVEVGTRLGHEVAVFDGSASGNTEGFPTARDVTRFDLVLFVLHVLPDVPPLPDLGDLIDRVPRDRRVVIDCYARYNDSITVEDDFNHHQAMESHEGWEWVEGIRALGGRILQPTLHPLRSDVTPFLFHGYAGRAANCARGPGRLHPEATYGMTYVGNNWQRWSQLKEFFVQVAGLRKRLDRVCLAGLNWDERPDWAVALNLGGVTVEPDFLREQHIEIRGPVEFDQVTAFLGSGSFTLVVQRPLFNQLGFVCNRLFEAFCANTIPLLLLPQGLTEEVYGPVAAELRGGEDPAARLADMIRRPEHYWGVVQQVRAHLAQHHSFEQRFTELVEMHGGLRA